MGEEQDQGFVIRDRRGRSEERSTIGRPNARPPRPRLRPLRRITSTPIRKHRPGHLPVNFSSFVISMEVRP